MSLEHSDRYDDIINLPHHQSRKHPHMTMHNRAAQFMPFAALKGFEATIDETARRTKVRVTLGPDEQLELNEKLIAVLGQLASQPWVTITHFEPDGRKDGGDYLVTEGIIHHFDQTAKVLIMDDDSRIALTNIVDIQY
ncbi:hypothetical protein [Bifidobacterium gallicum]|uniref:YolD-like protein n=1 Tax=Bifidobacterium gallicum DSM 20093 = LMG 11596 TaxID=561180 RepID=D1NUN7_9BIFI|nr:hypothetical protein [Bifidobacterium gallicum]EFA22538.1 hypothetical protein BIFGAL_03563 [Bifidobacterium gallicum DSM 20093 = LMG 11596]KFI59529.1 hypothetical protein BGLCM_0194 [Bifidobacterium gallicum DSM 20093 = LMG 11596]